MTWRFFLKDTLFYWHRLLTYSSIPWKVYSILRYSQLQWIATAKNEYQLNKHSVKRKNPPAPAATPVCSHCTECTRSKIKIQATLFHSESEQNKNLDSGIKVAKRKIFRRIETKQKGKTKERRKTYQREPKTILALFNSGRGWWFQTAKILSTGLCNQMVFIEINFPERSRKPSLLKNPKTPLKIKIPSSKVVCKNVRWWRFVVSLFPLCTHLSRQSIKKRASERLCYRRRKNSWKCDLFLKRKQIITKQQIVIFPSFFEKILKVWLFILKHDFYFSTERKPKSCRRKRATGVTTVQIEINSFLVEIWKSRKRAAHSKHSF